MPLSAALNLIRRPMTKRELRGLSDTELLIYRALIDAVLVAESRL